MTQRKICTDRARRPRQRRHRGRGVEPLQNTERSCRRRPRNAGQTVIASAGAGTLTHLAGELLNMEGKIKLVHTPYRGAAPAVADLLGGHVQSMLPDLPGVLPQISGRLDTSACHHQRNAFTRYPRGTDHRRSRIAERAVR